MSTTRVGMTAERYTELMRNDKARLTEEESVAGWHFCWEWDGLLIHKADPEFECCTCFLGKYV